MPLADDNPAGRSHTVPARPSHHRFGAGSQGGRFRAALAAPDPAKACSVLIESEPGLVCCFDAFSSRERPPRGRAAGFQQQTRCKNIRPVLNLRAGCADPTEAGGFEGSAPKPAPPSDHTPLVRRCAVRNALPFRERSEGRSKAAPQSAGWETQGASPSQSRMAASEPPLHRDMQAARSSMQAFGSLPSRTDVRQLSEVFEQSR